MTPAYFSGLFDGEGCIQLAKNGNSYQIRASLHNTYLPVIQELQRNYGGTYRLDKTATLPHCQEVYKWTITCNEAVEFLEDIQEDSIIKYDQISSVLNWNVMRQNMTRIHTKQYHPDFYVMSKAVHQRLKDMKRTGGVR